MSVRVVVRIRPGSSNCLQLNSRTVTLKSQNFTFDKVFGPEASQCDLFDNCFNENVDHALVGLNAAIIAYGQTAAGKSFTMMGDRSDEGIIPRAVKRIMACQEDTPEIVLSYVEIHMDRVHDLLNRRSSVELNGDGTPRNATQQRVSSIDEALSVIHTGDQLRSKATTTMNAASSRSHSILSVQLHNGARIMLVDLAGSEGAKKSGAKGATFKEACEINKSLSALALVVSMLATKTTNRYVPFRDSKLTQFLKPALGQNCKSTMIINCSSDPIHAAETLSSLKFGARAKMIKTASPETAVHSKHEHEFWKFWNRELSSLIRKWDIFGPSTAMPDVTALASYTAQPLERVRLFQDVASLTHPPRVEADAKAEAELAELERAIACGIAKLDALMSEKEKLLNNETAQCKHEHEHSRSRRRQSEPGTCITEFSEFAAKVEVEIQQILTDAANGEISPEILGRHFEQEVRLALDSFE